MRILEGSIQPCCFTFPLTQREFLFQGFYNIPFRILYSSSNLRCNYAPLLWRGDGGEVFDLHINKHLRTLFRDIIIMQEHASSCHFSTFQRVGNMNRREPQEPHVTIYSPVVGKVELALFLAWRIVLVVAIIGSYGYETGIASLNVKGREVDVDGQISSQMFLHHPSVDVDLLLTHDALEMYHDLLSLHVAGHNEMLPIPARPLIVASSAGLGGHQLYSMWSTNHRPCSVIKIYGFCSLCIAKQETPSLVEVINHAATTIQREKPGHGLRR